MKVAWARSQADLADVGPSARAFAALPVVVVREADRGPVGGRLVQVLPCLPALAGWSAGFPRFAALAAVATFAALTVWTRSGRGV